MSFNHFTKSILLTAALVTLSSIAHAQSKKVTLMDAHKGTIEIDLRIMNQFTDQPQAVENFYTAARKELTENGDLTLACKEFGRNKIAGPMLGNITTQSVSVWMNLPCPAAIRVVVTPVKKGDPKTFITEADTQDVTVSCNGLQPDTAYSYEVTRNNDGAILGDGQFLTLPVNISEKPFRIAFGSDFHKAGLYQPELMRLIQARGNRAMVFIGDSAVDDRRNDLALIKTDYLLRDLSAPWQKLARNVPVYGIWDDHDYFDNDASGDRIKATRRMPEEAIKIDALRQLWQAQWNNPERETQRDGIYFQAHLGPIHLIVLDTRSCRVISKRHKKGCYLGAEQTLWLKKQLAESTAPYILISSGTMWNDHISKAKDSWGSWDKKGREEIYQWIAQKKNAQVILLSGDRHGARGFTIPRPNSPDLYEFEAGSLGQVKGPAAFGPGKTDQLFGYAGSAIWAFGEFTFQLQNGKPHATFRLINEKGAEVETIQIERGN